MYLGLTFQLSSQKRSAYFPKERCPWTNLMYFKESIMCLVPFIYFYLYDILPRGNYPWNVLDWYTWNKFTCQRKWVRVTNEIFLTYIILNNGHNCSLEMLWLISYLIIHRTYFIPIYHTFTIRMRMFYY